MHVTESASCPLGWAVGCLLVPQCLARLRNVGGCGPAASAWPAILGPCSLEMERCVVGRGQGNWSPLWALGGKDYVRRVAEPRRAHHTHSPTRHPLLAVSGAPTAQRVPALDVMGPAPQRMTAESTSERSSGRGTARKLRVGPLTVSSAHGKASACGHGSSRGQVRLWSWSLEGLEAWTSESQRKAGVRGRKAGDWTSKSERAGLTPLGLEKKGDVETP